VLAAFNTNDPGLRVLEIGLLVLVVGWIAWRVVAVALMLRRRWASPRH
jgi:hypothetical protein